MIYDKIISKVPIDRGWSRDRKYHVTTSDGGEYLLRVSPPESLDRSKAQFVRMQAVAALDIPMCLPLEYGICEDGPYSIQSWIRGRDAEEVLPSLPRNKQYTYGLDAGRILKKIHTLPAPTDLTPWADRFNRKIDRKIAMYAACGLTYEDGEAFLRHIANTRLLLSHRPQSYRHGDYHTGNMMIDENGVLTVIDFDRDDYGDPWEEFNRIVWCAKVSPAFASGLVDGYCDGRVSMDFWNLLALYLCANAIGSLPWAIPFGEAEITTMRENAALLLSWYDHFQTVIPNWYHKEEVL